MRFGFKILNKGVEYKVSAVNTDGSLYLLPISFLYDYLSKHPWVASGCPLIYRLLIKVPQQ